MTSPHIADILARKYLIAAAVVAFLVLGNEVWLEPYMMRLTTDAPLINIAGRQRMLSQRLAKAALAFDAGKVSAPGPISTRWSGARLSGRRPTSNSCKAMPKAQPVEKMSGERARGAEGPRAKFR